MKAIIITIFSYPLYVIFSGFKDLLIDMENAKLATTGSNKVCFDVSNSDSNPVTGGYTQTKKYKKGDPSIEPKRFMNPISFMKKLTPTR